MKIVFENRQRDEFRETSKNLYRGVSFKTLICHNFCKNVTCHRMAFTISQKIELGSEISLIQHVHCEKNFSILMRSSIECQKFDFQIYEY